MTVDRIDRWLSPKGLDRERRRSYIDAAERWFWKTLQPTWDNIVLYYQALRWGMV
jgi:hypothetical protein